MAALTYQSQLTANMAANLSQQMDHYIQTLTHQQEQLHQNQHQIIKQLAALLFNQRDVGQGIRRQGRGPPPQAPFAPIQFGGNNFGSHGGQGCGRGQGRGRGHGPPAFTAGRAPPLMTIMAGRTPVFPGMHPATGGGYYAPPPPGHVQAPPYSNLMKRFANLNACYSCGFNVANGHTSQMCPLHLRKPDHNEYFTWQNAQQYINAGYGCSTKMRHRSVFLTM
jgi:hypothetical protein